MSIILPFGNSSRKVLWNCKEYFGEYDMAGLTNFFIAKFNRNCLFVTVMVCLSAPAFALHPLITDDTGTQGRGGLQLEFGYEHDHLDFRWLDRNPESILISKLLEGQSNFGKVLTRDDINVTTLTITYGIIDNLDVVVGIPHLNIKSKESRLFYSDANQFLTMKSTTTSSGISDIVTEFKWKFFEYKAVSLGLKPGIIFPSGEEYRGLGNGRLGAYGYFLTTLEITPVVMHVNLGYIRNENSHMEREDIWHGSVAFEIWVVKDFLRLVANCALERNRYKWSNINDVTAVGGIILSPTEDFDIDFGFKWRFSQKGTQSPAAQYTLPQGIFTRPDYSLTGGMTMRFNIHDAIKKIGEKTEKK
jgi:hypothetical protein